MSVDWSLVFGARPNPPPSAQPSPAATLHHLLPISLSLLLGFVLAYAFLCRHTRKERASSKAALKTNSRPPDKLPFLLDPVAALTEHHHDDDQTLGHEQSWVVAGFLEMRERSTLQENHAEAADLGCATPTAQLPG